MNNDNVSLRDYFAGLALQVLMDKLHGTEIGHHEAVNYAYQYADLMLKARENE